MPAIPVAPGVYSVGVLNPNLRIFDVVMCTEYGTSYNAYLLQGSEKTVLIETCHDTFFEQYLDNIRSVCPLERIDAIILNHCEPDHSGVLHRLLALCPNAEVIGTAAAGIYLKKITNNDALPFRAVKQGDTYDLGGGQLLHFYPSPFLHWPDTMFTYAPHLRTVFTCDFLGSHFCEPQVFDHLVHYQREYFDALHYYFCAIFGPFMPYVRKGLDILDTLAFDTACTSHGPVLTRGGLLPQVLTRYRGWSAEAPPRAHVRIPVFYATAYGNTERIAEGIRQGVLQALPDAECTLYNVNEHDMATLQELLCQSDAFALGSPTINADAVPPMWELLSHIDAINCKKKPALLFGSFGWSGEALGQLQARLEGLKMKVYAEQLRVPFVPSDADIQTAASLGQAFALSIQQQ